MNKMPCCGAMTSSSSLMGSQKKCQIGRGRKLLANKERTFRDRPASVPKIQSLGRRTPNIFTTGLRSEMDLLLFPAWHPRLPHAGGLSSPQEVYPHETGFPFKSALFLVQDAVGWVQSHGGVRPMQFGGGHPTPNGACRDTTSINGGRGGCLCEAFLRKEEPQDSIKTGLLGFFMLFFLL